MSNPCLNSIYITGNGAASAIAEFNRIALAQREVEVEGMSLFQRDPLEHYLFETETGDKENSFGFVTKYSPPVADLQREAQERDFEFFLPYESEADEDVGQVKYENGKLFARTVDTDVFDRITETEDGGYIYEEQHFDAKSDIFDELLANQAWEEVEVDLNTVDN